MSRPEALRLADVTRLSRHHEWHLQVDAELRRLHAENKRLHQINRSHEVKLSVRGYEIQIADLEAQRDALLAVVNKLEYSSDGCIKRYPEESEVNAAIAKAEGQ